MGHLAALLLSWQVISWRTLQGSWHQGTTTTRLNPDEASGRQGSAWRLNQMCLGEKLAAMREWRHTLGETLHARRSPDTPEGP